MLFFAFYTYLFVVRIENAACDIFYSLNGTQDFKKVGHP